MTKSNSLGFGLQSEVMAMRFQISEAQKKIKAKTAAVAVSPPAAPSLPKRNALVFAAKLPGVSKPTPTVKKTPGTRRKLVVQVKVKSPALRRTLGMQ